MPATVPAGYGAYLKSTARYTTATISGALAAWGDKAVTSEIISALAFKADADAEVTRQAQFMAGPIVRDKVVVKGQRRDLMCRPVTIYGDRSGYENGAVVFVIGYAEADTGNTTTLSVLKRTFT